MCARARDLAAAGGVRLEVAQADMRDFSLPGRFDLAITMLNSCRATCCPWRTCCAI